MKKLILFLTLSIPILFPLQLFAGDGGTPATKESIKALLEVVNVSRMASDTTQQILAGTKNQMVSLITSSYSQPVSQDPKLKAISDSHGEKLQALYAAYGNIVFSSFEHVYAQKVPIKELTEKICYSVYQKYFSDKEIQDMIAFYKTPTGQKTLQVMPALMADITDGVQMSILPETNKLLNQLLQDEWPKFMKDLRELEKK